MKSQEVEIGSNCWLKEVYLSLGVLQDCGTSKGQCVFKSREPYRVIYGSRVIWGIVGVTNLDIYHICFQMLPTQKYQ